MKNLYLGLFGGLAILLTGCATLTEDAMTPITFTFSDGSNGACNLSNKRGVWTTPVPGTVMIRKSDDTLKFDCKTENGDNPVGGIPSTMGAKIVASALFLDFGITDAITDKHRQYAASWVVPIVKTGNESTSPDENTLQEEPANDSTSLEENSGNPEEDAKSGAEFLTKLNQLDDLMESKTLAEDDYLTERCKLFTEYFPNAEPDDSCEEIEVEAESDENLDSEAS
jgi:hypothetical protein